MTTTAPGQETSPATMRRVAASVLIGTTIEWYDFILYLARVLLVRPADVTAGSRDMDHPERGEAG